MPLQVDREWVLRAFLELVAVDSPTGHEGAIGDVLEVRFCELGCETRRDDIGNREAVLARTREGTILVSTHLDTAGTDREIVPVVGEDRVTAPTVRPSSGPTTSPESRGARRC